MATTTKNVLSKLQRQRAAALRVARDVLATSGAFSQGAADALDVIRVADYILSGVEYLDRPPAPPEPPEEPQRATPTAWLGVEDKDTGETSWRPLGGVAEPGFTFYEPPEEQVRHAFGFDVEETGPKWFGEEAAAPGIPSAASREALRRLLGDDWDKLPDDGAQPSTGHLPPGETFTLPEFPTTRDLLRAYDEEHSEGDMPGRAGG